MLVYAWALWVVEHSENLKLIDFAKKHSFVWEAEKQMGGGGKAPILLVPSPNACKAS